MDSEVEAVRRPLVTCCMITTADRSALARESARSFARQRLKDRELLVISSPMGSGSESVEDLSRLEEAVREEAGDASRFVHLAAPHSLGAMRNLSFAHARGSYLCQWDDDDLAHPDRVGDQLACLREGTAAAGAVGSMLTEAVHLFVDDNQAFICNWKRAPQGGFPGAVLFRAGASARYPESGEESRRGEDTVFALALQREGKLVNPARGPLYLYRFHGGNTWSREHHLGLVERLAISRALLLHREAALRPFLEELGLARGVELRGPNGHAFTF